VISALRAFSDPVRPGVRAPQQTIISLADLLLTSATTTTLEKTKVEEQQYWCWRRPKRASTVMVGVKQSGRLGSSNGRCFGEDVVSELPFIETRVDVRGRAGDMVLTDGERLISFVCISLINGYIEIVKLLLERDADIQCDEASVA
jgi:hypothetical protein